MDPGAVGSPAQLIEQQGGDVACFSSADGGTSCETPEEPTTSECSFGRIECDSDDDCNLVPGAVCDVSNGICWYAVAGDP